MTIYTIGHSTRQLEELVDILKFYRVEQLVDVRSIPRSRHTPQFNKDVLSTDMQNYDITYRHISGLGGRRYSKKDSINTGWRNASFRGYADYMQTKDFKEGLEALIKASTAKSTAIMCAEAVPWRCHRSMVGDALLIRDIEVIDIFDRNKAQTEKLTSFAKVDGLKLTYPPITND